MAIELSVEFKPPYKQSPADQNEKNNQVERTEKLQNAAREKWTSPPGSGDVSLSIVYYRNNKGADSANIIGGIADALENIVYKNDNQVKSIQYKETKADKDHYTVSILMDKE